MTATSPTTEPHRRRAPAAAALVVGLTLGALSLPASAIHCCSEVTASGGVAVCGDITARDIVIGLKPGEVQELMRELFAQESAAVAKIEELSRRLGVTDAATRRFFAILGERRVPVERLPERLAEIAGRHKELLARLRAFRTDDPEVQALRQQAANAIEAGDYDLAEAQLVEARQAVRTARERLRAAPSEQALQEAQEAQIEAEFGELRLTQLDYLTAAEHFREAAEIVPPSAPEARADYLNRYAGALQVWLRRTGPEGVGGAAADLGADEAPSPAERITPAAPGRSSEAATGNKAAGAGQGASAGRDAGAVVGAPRAAEVEALRAALAATKRRIEDLRRRGGQP